MTMLKTRCGASATGVILAVAFFSCSINAQQPAQSEAPPGAAASAEPPVDWKTAEAKTLANQAQLTFADRFYKAGEAYFSPDNKRIIFQAVEATKGDAEPDPFYAMFVADLTFDESGRPSGLGEIKRLSPKASANTCGWFHPTDPNIVIFGSTLGPPTESNPPGYDRATGRYKWMFPPEMRIVQCDVTKADGTAATLETIVGNGAAYCAEGSISRDGRHLVYCSLESNQGDLYVVDLMTKSKVCLVSAQGYDGGPFFSPDGRRICYRSDRIGNNLLQLYVADLAFNARGEIIGIEREYQLTDNADVNWAPFWHPGGRFLLYTTSQISHRNYEVFFVDADNGFMQGSTGSIKYGTRDRRVTFADRADVLPVFDSTGKHMMWTSQRGEDGESQLWIADFVLELDPKPTFPSYQR